MINMSYGSDEIDEEGNPISLVGYSQAENDAVNYAWGKGVLLVSAAGNAGDPIKNYPAAYDNVIAVGATDDDDNRASFSSFGSDWVSLMAPGDSILSTMPNEQCGTSITIMTPVCIGSRVHPWPALMLLAQLRYFGHTNMQISYPILQLAKMPLAYLVTR